MGVLDTKARSDSQHFLTATSLVSPRHRYIYLRRFTIGVRRLIDLALGSGYPVGPEWYQSVLSRAIY